MKKDLSNYSYLFSKKATLLLLAISFFLFSPVLLFTIDKTRFTKTPIIIEGIIQFGIEENQPRTLHFIETHQGVYYLVDNTDKSSRRQRATKNCPTGMVSCYRKVSINGYATNKKILLLKLRFPNSSPQDEARKVLQAQELIVLSFEALE